MPLQTLPRRGALHRVNVAHCHLGLSTLFRKTGQPDHARGYLTTATTMLRDMGMSHWLEQTEAELVAFS
jgi:hypothetical protein